MNSLLVTRMDLRSCCNGDRNATVASLQCPKDFNPVSSLHENLFIGYVVLVLMPIVATLMTRFFLIEESDMFHTENTQVINFVLSLLVYDHEQSIQTKVSPGADSHHLLTHLQDVYVFDSFFFSRIHGEIKSALESAAIVR